MLSTWCAIQRFSPVKLACHSKSHLFQSTRPFAFQKNARLAQLCQPHSCQSFRACQHLPCPCSCRFCLCRGNPIPCPACDRCDSYTGSSCDRKPLRSVDIAISPCNLFNQLCSGCAGLRNFLVDCLEAVQLRAAPLHASDRLQQTPAPS